MASKGVYIMEYDEREPTWLILKKAAEQLFKQGKIAFTRRELINYAKKYLAPDRPISSLDFEVDLVTVNGSSKDKYRDPEKLFLFRIGRGKYTLYDPELHGPIEKYLGVVTGIPTRKNVLENVAESLEKRGYHVQEVNQPGRATAPDLIATDGSEKVGIWVIDPAGDHRSQMRALAYSIGSALIERKKYNWVMVIAPPDILAHIPSDIREVLEKHGIRFVIIEEERRYTVKL